MEVKEFNLEVVNALERRGVSRVDYIGETSTQQCSKDAVPFERFVGMRGGWQFMAHVCPKCRKMSVWNLDISQPAEHFGF